jgi:tetratricopeptide (TPR) repeat protein
MNSSQQQKLQDAQAAQKQASKLSAPTFLGIRTKGDWPSATPLYEKAALLFQQVGTGSAVDRAIECWLSAVQGHKAQESLWHAAKALERAADLAKDSRQYDRAYTLYVDCGELYVEAGRAQTAAEAASRGASALSEVDASKASKLHAKAVRWLEESDKEGQYPDVYRQAALHAVRSKAWSDAIRVELGLALSAYTARSYSTACKAYLAAIVVGLYSEDGKTAWQTYQDALDVPEFASSDQAFAAQDLFQAIATADSSVVDACVDKTSCLKFLDNCIVRLLKRIGSTTDLAKTARGLPEGVRMVVGVDVNGSDDDDDDLT